MQKKLKKGISPLIATVFIIGLTVALGATIMKWGSGFTKKMTKAADETSKESLTCNSLVFEIQNICRHDYPGNFIGISLTIANNGDSEIENFTARAYASKTVIYSGPLDISPFIPKNSLAPYGISKFLINTGTPVPDTPEIRMVEVVPKIMNGNKLLTCSGAIEVYGSLNDDPITACPII